MGIRDCGPSSDINCQPKITRVGPTGHTPGGSPATPQNLAQEVREFPYFYVGSTLPHNQCGTNPHNLPLTYWCPLALTGPTPQSTSNRLHIRAHMGLTPAGPPLTGSTHEHTRASHPRVHCASGLHHPSVHGHRRLRTQL